MITNDQIEAYLLETGLPYQQEGEGFWIVQDDPDSVENLVVVHTPPIITFRLKVMDVSNVKDRTTLFRHLLRLNAGSMIGGAYGLEDNAVVIVDSLQSENLDYNEFQAAIDAIAMAVREHYPELSELLKNDATDAAS